MQNQTNSPDLSTKVIYLVIATICVMIGVVGLIIPIIPGILFLFVAIFCLGKVSTRVRDWSHRQPVLNKLQRKFHRMNQVGVGDRIRVAALMSADMLVGSLDQAAKSANRLRRNYF